MVSLHAWVASCICVGTYKASLGWASAGGEGGCARALDADDTVGDAHINELASQLGGQALVVGQGHWGIALHT